MQTLSLYHRCESCDCLLSDQQRDWHDGSVPHHEPVPVHPAVPWHHQPGCRGADCRGRHLCPAPLYWVLPGQHVDGQVEAHTVTPSQVLLLRVKTRSWSWYCSTTCTSSGSFPSREVVEAAPLSDPTPPPLPATCHLPWIAPHLSTVEEVLASCPHSSGSRGGPGLLYEERLCSWLGLDSLTTAWSLGSVLSGGFRFTKSMSPTFLNL